MAFLDLRLNKYIATVPCLGKAELHSLFTDKAMLIREGVSNSPRGSHGTPPPYDGPHQAELASSFVILYDTTNPASNLPLNRLALDLLHVRLYGAVFIARMFGSWVDSLGRLTEDDVATLRYEAPPLFL